jgi:hypothetical protein
MVSYESLRQDTEGSFADVMKFICGDVNEAALAVAMERSSFSEMRKAEEQGKFTHYSMTRSGVADPMALKTREGKVGGFARHLSADDISWANQTIHDALDPYYEQYRSAVAVAVGAAEEAN